VVAQIGALGNGASHCRPVICLSAGRAGEGPKTRRYNMGGQRLLFWARFFLEWMSRVVLSGRPLFHGLRSLADGRQSYGRRGARSCDLTPGCRRRRRRRLPENQGSSKMVERKGTREPLGVGRWQRRCSRRRRCARCQRFCSLWHHARRVLRGACLALISAICAASLHVILGCPCVSHSYSRQRQQEGEQNH
jgi:hypothetical protein